MPELPEVETIVRGLNEWIGGKIIAEVDCRNPGSFPSTPEEVDARLLGASVRAVERRGKVVRINLNNDWVILIHLKMTGQLIYAPSRTEGEAAEAMRERWIRAVLHFQDGSRLYFNDQRKFGWMKLMSADAATRLPFFRTIGPEPLERRFTAELLGKRLAGRPGSPVKAALLDQKVVAGIGNIYADESLFLAGIDPERRCRDLSVSEMGKLHRAIRRVLREAIDQGGSTREHYRNAIGQKGDYLEQARVYGRVGLPCPRCTRPIAKKRTAGRGTHYCPHCQR